MSDEFAARSPVETIHSGPAASAIGGRFLSGLDDALVVDVGGTTTDIALIQAGQVAVSEEGATVGNYKTAVKAANLLSIALGGDSRIGLNNERHLCLGPERVTPLAFLAAHYPSVQSQLKALARRTWTQSSPEWLEYWFLLREPRDNSLLRTPQEKALVDLLQKGPQPLPEIVKHLNLLHAAQISANELLRQEVIGKAGLTPTDLLHVEGRFAPWDAASAEHAVEVFCRLQFMEPTTFQQQIWERITETIVQAIVTFLTGRPLPAPSLPRDNDLGRWFFYNSLRPQHGQLEPSLRLKQPLIGIGAPAAVFLPRVAEVLHTDLVLPEHHSVANAVGAVAGSVMVSEEILVYPRLSASGLEVTGYYVQTSDSRAEFEELSAAIAHARAIGQERALGAALRSGAEQPQLVVEELSDGLDTYRIRARAMGSPRLGR